MITLCLNTNKYSSLLNLKQPAGLRKSHSFSFYSPTCCLSNVIVLYTWCLLLDFVHVDARHDVPLGRGHQSARERSSLLLIGLTTSVGGLVALVYADCDEKDEATEDSQEACVDGEKADT
jgi:hypothetical protein